MVARTIRTSEQIRAEIQQTFGFFPPFFEPALSTPQVLENLWQQTLFAYIHNPLSALFKERLNAVLSRFCAAPYCMVVHSAALRPLGMTARQVLALLETPPEDQESDLPLGVLPAPQPEEAVAPAPDSPLEQVLLSCAAALFLEQANTEQCQAEIRRLLGPELYSHLVAYLAYIKTCHLWIESHPEISYEADQRAQDNLGPLLAEEPALADFFRTYQTRVASVLRGRMTQAAVTAERMQSEEAIRGSEEKLRLLVDGARDYAMILLNVEGQVTSWNAGAERILGWTEEEVLGQFADLIFTPEDRAAGVPAQEMTRAATEGKTLDLRWHIKKDGSRFFADGIMEGLHGADGPLRGFAKVLRDTTERAERAERERFLADLAERARALADPDEVIVDAVRSVGEFLSVGRCVFGDIDLRADTCTIVADWCADDTVASIVGTFPFSAFGAFVVAEYRMGRTVVVEDVRLDHVRVPEANVGPYESMNIRAHITAPVVHSSRLVSVIAVHNGTSRRWKTEEVELLQTVVERTWLTVAVLRQQQDLVREAEALREAHEQTAAILESITDAFFALDADWRFTYLNDQAERLLLRSRADLIGKVVWDEFPAAVGTEFDLNYRRAAVERTAVSFEAYYPPPLAAWFEVRAFPSKDGLSIYFHEITDRKAAEAARDKAQAALLEHEQTIASQLQAALQPDLPGAVPGLKLARHYEAGLPEAGVGGDFYDVFALEKGCTALVVGDVSGKGLDAAAQVATVRNTLRGFLYTKSTIAKAATDLNDVLAENDLLTGFATLFVGAYESGTRELRYANCGQEPALLRRASTGVVEQLLPTGPVMGVIKGARFSEAMTVLEPGDAFAIFSDGLTECGPDRKSMLEIEGVAALFGQALADGEAADAQEEAELRTLRLIEGVDRYAQGGVRDDVVLLVGVAT